MAFTQTANNKTHIGFLLSAISFGFQGGEKYILGIIHCTILIFYFIFC